MNGLKSRVLKDSSDPGPARKLWFFFIISDIFESRDGTKLDKCELGSTEMVVNGVWPKTAVMNRSRY